MTRNQLLTSHRNCARCRTRLEPPARRLRHPRHPRPRSTKPANTAATSPALTTRISPSPLGFFPSSCARISSMSTPIAASPTIWAMRSATPPLLWRLLDQWQTELDACYAGTPRHPVFVALAETVGEFDIPQARIFRSPDRLPPGPDRHPIRNLRRCPRLLPLLGESRRASRSLPVWISRRRAPATFRLHLHRAATGKLLAGRHRGLRQRPDLSAARRSAPLFA